MQTTVHWKEDFLYESITPEGYTMTLDMRETGKTSQGPMESVLSAVAGCVAVDIVLMLRKKRKTILGFRVENKASRRDTPPRSFTSIHSTYILQSPDTTEEELRKVATLALDKYCSVASSLIVKVEFDVRVES
jgi:putative redox protein